MSNLRTSLLATLLLVLAILAPMSGPAELWREDFSADPRTRGWYVHGDSSHFRWNEGANRLGVTWDSLRPNAFFHLPLPTVLTRAESFRFRFTLVLDDIATESPEATFPLALGLIGRTQAFSPASFRGAGIHPTWGSRNLLEFAYFPPSTTITPTFSTVAVATNNTRWATLDLFPLELDTGATYDIEVRHDATAFTLSLRALRNGLPFAEGVKALSSGFGDFRLDAFSVTSYSGDHQPAAYGGQMLAHGFVDDLELEFPAPPRPILEVLAPGGLPRISLPSIPSWTAFLERRDGDVSWVTIPVAAESSSGRWSFTDPFPPTDSALYRVRLERP